MATEKRLIDAERVRYELDIALMESYGKRRLGIADAIEVVNMMPTVDAVEVVHGRWVNNKDDYPECDKCGYMPQYDPMIDDIWYSPYCPKCGAKMEGCVQYA